MKTSMKKRPEMQRKDPMQAREEVMSRPGKKISLARKENCQTQNKIRFRYSSVLYSFDDYASTFYGMIADYFNYSARH